MVKSEIEEGNVAIVSRVVASQNRDHHHSKLILESGSLSTGAHDVGVSGWEEEQFKHSTQMPSQ